MNNIILIGMPGCGKTTIGRILSEKLAMNFLDLDEYIVEKYNMTIDDMFKIGESYFRDRESEVVRELDRYNNTIIATGGGVIKREINGEILRSCGYVVFIHRLPENILRDVDNLSRTLLKDDVTKIYNLYNERYDLYKKYCHIEVDNNYDIDNTLKELINISKRITSK